MIAGRVVRLHREKRSGNGSVTILGSVADAPQPKLRRVWVNLAESDYQRAIPAHERDTDVRVWGVLEQRGKRTYLNNAGRLSF